MDDSTTTILKCEIEPPQQRTLASIQLGHDIWWSGAVTVPEDGSGIGVLEPSRRGTGEETEATLLLPVAELPALVTLLEHLAAQATA